MLLRKVKARVSLHGLREAYNCVALVDTGARMTIIDSVLAERIRCCVHR